MITKVQLNKVWAIFLFFLMAFTNLQAQDDFITVWKTDNVNQTISIPIIGKYDIEYSINDITITDKDQNGAKEITFSNPGNHVIKIKRSTSGKKYESVSFYEHKDATKLVEIINWGNNPWSTMKNAFYGCENLDVTAKDAPDLSNVTTLANMFNSCYSLNGNSSFGTWNVVNIENMSGMFAGTLYFNQDISDWNVSNVKNMNAMFIGARNFNRDISNWTVTNVENMAAMFAGATRFNKDISDWDVSNVEDMQQMFFLCYAFNQKLNRWNVSNVVTMESMFQMNPAFNQDLSDWDVSEVKNMKNMFFHAQSFNQDLSEWDVSNVKNMENMFRNVYYFNRDISEWDVSEVKNMNGMFTYASRFDKDISNWDVSNVISTDSLFIGAKAFNQNLGKWNLQKLTSGVDMFTETAMSVDNWDATITGWAKKNINYPNSVKIGAQGLMYCNSEKLRDDLKNNNNFIGSSPKTVETY